MGVSIADRDLDRGRARVLEQASTDCRSGPVDAKAEALVLEAPGPRPQGRLWPPLPRLPQTMPCQSQLDCLAEGPDLIPSAGPLAQRRKIYSREQSLAQVAAHNQQQKMVPFQPGQWKPVSGGRALGVPEALAEDNDPVLNMTPELAEKSASLQAWMAKSESSPFLAHPPASMLHLVRAILERDNAGLALEHVQACSQAHAEKSAFLSP
jgi:hypothetical protein